jgi:hypothetical protein
MPRRQIRRVKKNTVLESVRIRMCRQGLGDCFLLTFNNRQQQQFNLMIDCGVLPFSGGDKRLKTIVQKLLAENHGSLDAVVVTHEHADHISGFAENNFTWIGPDGKEQPPQINQVWMAWTENPDDDQVKEIVKNVNALSYAVMGVASVLSDEERAQIQPILYFQGIELSPAGQPVASADGNAANAAHFEIKVGLDKIMKTMRGRVPSPTYFSQKDIKELPEFGVRFYCLGPSRDMPMLGGHADGGDSGLALRLDQTNAFLAAAAKYAQNNLSGGTGEGFPDVDVDELFELSQPFGREKIYKLSELKNYDPSKDTTTYMKENKSTAEFFNRVYGFGDKDTKSCPAWRRVDTDWMHTGAQIALQQVSLVNNTSFVLAIELVESGKVLLFAGDAEEDNWHTWKNDKADVKDLLSRTVVYKVGHHGSINGTDSSTLKDKMTNKDLVALIPADVAVAHSKTSKSNPDGWQFPDPSLYNLDPNTTDKGLLFNKTDGRIIILSIEDADTSGPNYDKTLAWPGEIVEDAAPEKLWVDYVLKFK